MHRTRQIAIILSDTLQSIGLQSLLTDYFPPVEVCWFPTFDTFNTAGCNDTFDYYFTSPESLGLNADFFLPYRTLPTDKPSEKSCRKSHHESIFPYQPADLQFCFDCGFDYYLSLIHI